MDTTTWAPGWLTEGHFLSYVDQGVRNYFQVLRRDIGHYEYTWTSSIAADSISGPTVLTNLRVTKADIHLHQLIFGMKPQIYVYIHVPTDMDRHGLPKVPSQTPTQRTIGHFNTWMSPWDQPDWITETFMQRPLVPDLALSVYNPNDIAVTPEFNFFVNKLILEPIGTDFEGVLEPSLSTREQKMKENGQTFTPRFQETLEKLYKRAIPCRHITLLPVRAPVREE